MRDERTAVKMESLRDLKKGLKMEGWTAVMMDHCSAA